MARATTSLKDEVILLWRDGVPPLEIPKRLAVSKTTVYSWIAQEKKKEAIAS